jgi:hypothetical protein
VSAGLITNLEEREHRPGRYRAVKGAQRPESEVLPTVDALWDEYEQVSAN